MKTCTKCGIQQSISSFHKDKQKKDGLSCSCKSCKKKYQQNNPEVFKQAKLRYEKANPDKVRATQRKYNQQNPEVASNRYHKRRAKVLGNGVYKISKRELARLYNSPCIYCGSREQINADHVIPVSRGGRHSIGNLVPACKKCNSSKSASYITEWKKRLSVSD